MRTNKPPYRPRFGVLFLACVVWIIYAGLVGYLPEPWNWVAVGIPVALVLAFVVWLFLPTEGEL